MKRLALLLLLAVVACRRPSTEHRLVVDAGVPKVLVMVSAGGATVSVEGQPLAAGCDAPGAGVSVPAVNGEQDFAALTVCMEKVKRRSGLPSQTSATIAADPKMSFAVVIGVMDALRPVFPDVSFAAPSADSHRAPDAR